MPPTPGHGTILDALKDSDPNLRAQPDSPQELLRKAEEPASELSVEEAVRFHALTCPAARKVRKWAMGLCFALGVLAASQWWIIHSGKAWIRESVRQAVREELGKTAVAQKTDWLIPEAFASKGSL